MSDRCEVCGARVEVYTGDEGTSSYVPVAERECAELRKQLKEVEAERDRLREALIRYGDHDTACNRLTTDECICGFW